MKKTTIFLFILISLVTAATSQDTNSAPRCISGKKNGVHRYGFVKADGTAVTDLIFYRARPFSEGLAAIRDTNGIWGFIDTTGKRTITMPKGVSEVGDFSEGVCWFRDRNSDEVGYIDRNGNVVLEPQWGFAGNFSDGLAAVGDAQTLGNMRNITGLTGYINHKGKLVISIDKTHSNYGNEGFNFRRAVIEKFGKVTIIDPAGKTIVERPEYTNARPFSEGLCAVMVATNWPCENKDNQRECVSKWGFIDTSGNMVIKPQFEWTGSFAEGLCVVKTGENKYTYIDHAGKNVMDRFFANAKPFKDGAAYVEELDGTIAFIDHTGKETVPIPEGYELTGDSQDGLIEVTRTETRKGISLTQLKLINAKGELVWGNERTDWIDDDGAAGQHATSGQKPKVSVTQTGNNCILNVDGSQYKFIGVEGGTYTMGYVPGQNGDTTIRNKSAHSETVSNFYIGETEVTQALWKTIMGTTVQQQWELSSKMWPKKEEGNNYPMYYVNYYDVMDFISKLNQLTGRTFRLPTEAEWEYAARGGNKSRGYRHSGSNDLGTVAWYKNNSDNKIHPVKTKKPNELGLYDMSGNVNEWLLDWYNTDEQGQIRGGSYSQNEADNAVTNCYVSHTSFRFTIQGFRLVLEP